jgi:hypothetical protein
MIPANTNLFFITFLLSQLIYGSDIQTINTITILKEQIKKENGIPAPSRSCLLYCIIKL